MIRILLALGFTFFLGFLASQALGADIRLDPLTATIDHGDWQQLSDAGFRFTVCGTVINTNDGGAYPVPAPCVVCESGPFNGAPAKCLAVWKAANTP